MKLLLVTAVIFCSLKGYSQTLSPFYKLNAPTITTDSLAKLPFLSGMAKAPAPGFYRMPLDRMPCIVPDTRTLAPMPNAWKGAIVLPYSGSIPNPALPKTFSLMKKG